MKPRWLCVHLRNYWSKNKTGFHFWAKYLSLFPLQLLQLSFWKSWSSLNFQILLKQLKATVIAKSQAKVLFSHLQLSQFKIYNTLSFLYWSFIHWTDGSAENIHTLATGRLNACCFPILTLWRSESCWWRSRASLVGNCRRHSRQTIFFQSVIFPSWSVALSEILSSGSLSPL